MKYFNMLPNLPAVPDDIVLKCKEIINDYKPTPTSKDMWLARPWHNGKEWHNGRLSEYFDFRQPGKHGMFYVVRTDDTLTNWVKQYIHPNPLAVTLQLMTGGSYIPPHTDFIRKYALNYLLSSNGPSTTFYEPKAEFKHMELLGGPNFGYERLDIADSYNFNQYEWHWIKVSNIHSVEGLSAPRYAITVSFAEIPIDWM
jgi:hypothetical protein